MNEHYYTASPTSAHDRRSFTADVGGQALSFVTDAGVFSKNEVDPGSRLLIEAMPSLEGRVLDLGCGWGAIGLFLKKRNPDIHLVCADVNERALSLARENARLNGLEAEFILSDSFSEISASFDHIALNPPIRAGKTVIYAMFDGALEHLSPGGDLTIVIRKQQGAPSAQKRLEEVFGNAALIARSAGYHIIRSVKEV